MREAWFRVARSFRCQVRAALFAAAGIALSSLFSAADLPRERIYYTTRRPVGWQVYLLTPGSLPRPLTDHPALSYDGVFSPDGRWIVFCSERSGSPQLYALELARPGLQRPLTRGPYFHGAPAFAPDGAEIFYVSDRNGNADIFRMPFRPEEPLSEEDAVNLTHHANGDYRPAVSPDGKQVAFSSDREFEFPYPYLAEIYVMNADGSEPRRLTTSRAMSGSPAWSRDGRTVYFYSNRDGGAFRIWAMNSDGGTQRAISPAGLEAVSPAVMPDGRIAFAAKQGASYRILSVAPDGSDLRPESGARECRGPAADRGSSRLLCTGQSGAGGRPFLDPGAREEVRLPDRILEVQATHAFFCAFGPGGREVATARWLTPEESNDMRLVVSRPDGSAERELFRPKKKDWIWGLAWAREADLLTFTLGPIFAEEDVLADIWTVRSDGSGARNLTGGRFRNGFPDVTADGREIVFRSSRDGGRNVYLMKSDGTNVRRITFGDGIHSMPAISPDGDLVVFATFSLHLQPLKGGRPEGGSRLFREFAPSVHPRFSPDGKWIVFVSRDTWLNDEGPLSDGENQPYGEIFVAPVSGGGDAIRLTHDKWEDSVPCWGPVPR